MTQETEAVPVREVVTKYHNGVPGACIQIKDFWAYVEKKKMVKHDLLKLNPEKREDFFMKWKHGMNDMTVNWEFEYSLRSFLKNFKDVSLTDVDPYFRDSLRMKRNFDEYCNLIKKEINLWTGPNSNQKLPKEVQELVDLVGGTVVSELVNKKENNV